jgi:IclR family transcriptional regulator, acetate operon repressor
MKNNKHIIPRYPLESVDHALAILLMLRDQPTLRVTDVSQMLGIGRSTAHRLLAALRYRGFVTQNPATRRYSTGQVLWELGAVAVQRLNLRGHARPWLEWLQQQTGETVHLVLLRETRAVFVEGVESRHILRVGIRTGLEVPAHMNAAGKALLAALPPTAVEMLYPDATLPTLTPDSISTRAELLRALEQVRAQGYGQVRGEYEEGVHAIGIAHTDPRLPVSFGIAVAAPATRLTMEREAQIVALAHRAAQQIAEALSDAITP